MDRSKGSIISIGVLFALGMGLFFVFIFGFSIKGTEEYACAMQQVRQSEVVAQALGEPIEPGFVAWLYQRETGGAMARASFSTSISGPRGRGRIRVDAYRAPVGAYLLVQFKEDGDWIDIYADAYPCR
ncbi:MAG: cytochrome c oxidase assembly factor Coa1 family protein [Anaerolineae bacterium]